MHPTDAHSHWRQFWLRSSPYIVLLALTAVGVAYTNVAPAGSLTYWQAVVPCFALVSIGLRWRATPLDSKGKLHLVATQFLHWGLIWLMMRTLYIHDVAILLDSNITSLVLIYLLALGSFLAAIYVNWRMAIVGAFLTLGGIMLAYVDEVAVLIVVAGVAVVAGIALWHFIRHRHSTAAAITHA